VLPKKRTPVKRPKVTVERVGEVVELTKNFNFFTNTARTPMADSPEINVNGRPIKIDSPQFRSVISRITYSYKGFILREIEITRLQTLFKGLAYSRPTTSSDSSVLFNDCPLLEVVYLYLNSEGSKCFHGTATTLLSNLQRVAKQNAIYMGPKGMPKGANTLSMCLAKRKESLKTLHIDLVIGHRNVARSVDLRLRGDDHRPSPSQESSSPNSIIANDLQADDDSDDEIFDQINRKEVKS